MQKIILVFLDEFNIYDLIEWTEKPIGMLGLFLTDMFIPYLQSYIEWAIDPNKTELAGNRTCLKKNNNIILVGSLFSDEPDGSPFFEISIPAFIKLLTEWEKLVKVKTKKITVIQSDDGTISVEGE